MSESESHWPEVVTEVYAVLSNGAGAVGLTSIAGGHQLPGGRFHLQESAEAALMRLVKEVHNLDIAVGSLSGLYQRPELCRLALVFRAELLDGDAAVLAWAKPGEWPADLVPGTTLRISDAMRFDGKTALRLQ